MRKPRLRQFCLLAVAVVFLGFGAVGSVSKTATASGTSPATPRLGPPALVVRYADSGPEALLECAETRWRTGEGYAEALRSGNGALDDWHARYRAQEVRALFAAPMASAAHPPLRARANRIARRIAARRAQLKLARVPPPLSPAAAPSKRSAALAHTYRIELAEGTDLDAALRALRANPAVVYAQPDHAYALDQLAGGFPAEPNDAFLETTGSWGQPFADLWGLDRIRAREAWQQTRGEGQVVAVVDTGIDYRHPDIDDNIWVNPGEDLDGNGRVDASDWNGVDDDGNGFVDDLRGWDFAGFGDEQPDGSFSLGDADPMDEVGHGTHVAGLVGAEVNNGRGIAGVAPAAKVMALKGFDQSFIGRDSDLWRAVLYAIENGADVINASWSCAPNCPINPLAREVLTIAREAGVVFVTSAGNRSSDVVHNDPENSTLAITVGSVGLEDVPSDFSNQGWLLDLMAPGGGQPRSFAGGRRNMLSLAASALAEVEEFFVLREEDGAGYWRQAGTSMAAPQVAGAAALLRSLRPELSAQEVRRMLRMRSDDLGAPGHDPETGAGVLDLVQLLEAEAPKVALEIVSPAPGDLFDPSASAVPIQFRAQGEDLVGFELAVATGLRGANFEPIRSGSAAVLGAALQRVDWAPLQGTLGPRVLRLRGELRSGGFVDEFMPIGFERIAPLRLSEGAVDEVAPRISGANVVWRAILDRTRGRGEVRAGGFARRGDVRIPTTISPSGDTDLDQSAPDLLGPDIVWVERSLSAEAAGPVSIRGCRFGGNSSSCRAGLLQESDGNLSGPRLDGRRLYFTEQRTEDDTLTSQILRCVRRSFRRCLQTAPVFAADPDRSVRLLDIDPGGGQGRGRPGVVLFSNSAAGGNLEFCVPAGLAGDCVPKPVFVEGFPLTAVHAVLSEKRLVFEVFRPITPLLGTCELDLESGDCGNARVLDARAGTRESAVSGRRIVWTEGEGDEPSTLAYCEVDPFDGGCERQTLTGSVAAARAPQLDGARLVWEDERFGPAQIAGLGLPELRAPESVRVREGRPRYVFVWSRDEQGDPLDVTIERVLPEGEAEADGWYADLRPLPGTGWSLARLKAFAAGSQASWLIRGRSASGLETRHRLDSVSFWRPSDPSAKTF